MERFTVVFYIDGEEEFSEKYYNDRDGLQEYIDASMTWEAISDDHTVGVIL